MKKAGKTLNKKGELVIVWECEYCGNRSIYKERIKKCESLCSHKEKFKGGDL